MKKIKHVQKNEKHIFRVCQFWHDFHLQVLVPRHSFVGELGQEHGDKCRKAPLRSQLVWADPCQPQDVLRDVWGFALEHSALVQMQSRWGKATEGCWDGQTHAGEETTPTRWVLILRPLKGTQERAASYLWTIWLFCLKKSPGRKVKQPAVALESTPSITQTLFEQVWPDIKAFYSRTSLDTYRTNRAVLKAAFPSHREKKHASALWTCVFMVTQGKELVLRQIECKHRFRYEACSSFSGTAQMCI